MDGAWNAAPVWVAVCVGVVMALVLLRRPVGALVRLAGRTGVGMAFLSLFSLVGEYIGASLGVNLFTGLTLGVLGVPGFGLLLLLNWVFR